MLRSGSFNAVAAQEAQPNGSQARVVRRALTAAEAAAPMRISLALAGRNPDELRRRVAAGEQISPAEMAAKYLPLAGDFAKVAAWLAAQGLTVAPAGASHTVVFATGTPAQLAAAFQTTFARVTYRAEEHTAAVTAPSLPADLAPLVTSIHGLQPYLHPRKHAFNPTRVGAPPYKIGDIFRAYDISPDAYTGAGQEIGIIIDTPPASADLLAFWRANGVPQTLDNISTVNLSTSALPAPTGEETLDVEWSSGMAPGAKVVVYACGDIDNTDAAFPYIIDELQSGKRPNLHQISMSFGSGETENTTDYLASTSQLFATITGYGVSIFVSSGDEGAYGSQTKTVQTEYPTSDPFVTSVGGTNLLVNSATGAVTSETAWSLLPGDLQSGNYEGSGGGVSYYFARPSWQVGAGVPDGDKRLTPDVSLPADPETGAYYFLNGQADSVGGTSWSTPMWAGLAAQINQARAASGLPPLGLANPFFYARLGTPSFRDITSGTNGPYNCTPGYDLVTGVGVPDFGVLVQSLVATALTAPVINSAPTASGRVGAPFAYQITATGTPTSFAATGLPAGLGIDPATGLIAGTPTAVVSAAASVSATNAGGTGTGTLTLTIGLPLPEITSPLTASAILGTPFSYQITATNAPSNFDATGLPDGLTLNATTGVIAGTPTTAGNFPVALTAHADSGNGTATLTLVVASTAPEVTLTATRTPVASDGGQPGVLVLTRTGDTALPLTVTYAVKGNAQPGVDYRTLPGFKVIPAGKRTAKVKVLPLGTVSDGQPLHKVRVILRAPDDGSYTLGSARTAKVGIVNAAPQP